MATLTISLADEKRVKALGFLNNRGTDNFRQGDYRQWCNYSRSGKMYRRSRCVIWKWHPYIHHQAYSRMSGNSL